MKTAVYARRSKRETITAKETGRVVHSITSQITWAEAKSEENNYNFLNPQTKKIAGRTVGKYIDDGVSGSKANREGLAALIQDIRKNKGIERVLIRYIDRLSRNTGITKAVLEYFDEKGVKVRFGDLWETGGENAQMIITIITAIAEQQRASTIRRIEEALLVAIEEGRLPGRPFSGFTVKDDQYVLKKDGKAVQEGMREGLSPEAIKKLTGLPISRIKRIIPRIRAWEKGGVDALREMVKPESQATMERLRRKEEREAREEATFRKWLIDLTMEARLA